MGNKLFDRRSFFSKLLNKKNNSVSNEDPLFIKYARKKSGRSTDTTEVSYKQRETAENNTIDTLRVNPLTTGLAPYSGTWDAWQAKHLLWRTNFGASKEQIDQAVNVGMDAAVDYILNENNFLSDTPPINYYEPDSPDVNNIPYGSSWQSGYYTYNPNNNTANDQAGSTNYDRQTSIAYNLAGSMFTNNTTIKEKLMWFWYHFIPIDFESVQNANYANLFYNSSTINYQYIKFIRDNLYTDFKTFIKGISLQPSMMFYLNNQANTAAAPDENFARELMELFTLGKDPASQYTQQDVIEAAKVLTGWRVIGIGTPTVVTQMDLTKHKTGSKTFSSFFNNTVIQNGGAAELDDLLNMIFAKSEIVAKYICRRLYRFFVYYDIDVSVENLVITPLAQIFVSNNFSIKPVLNALFKSEHFYDAVNKGVFIKQPFDVVMGFTRSFNISTIVSDTHNYNAQYKLWGRNVYANWGTSSMEQSIGKFPNVSGWNAFYQPTAYHEYWINSNTIQRRYTYLSRMIETGITFPDNGLTTTLIIKYPEYIQANFSSVAANPNTLIAEFIKYFLPVDISINKKNEIKLQTLLYNQTNDYYWTNAWNNYVVSPTNASYYNTVNGLLKRFFHAILELAEYQLI